MLLLPRLRLLPWLPLGELLGALLDALDLGLRCCQLCVRMLGRAEVADLGHRLDAATRGAWVAEWESGQPLPRPGCIIPDRMVLESMISTMYHLEI